MKKYFPLICSLVSAVIFGFSMLFIKTGMKVVNYDTVKFLAFRFTLGFICLQLLVMFKVQKVDYKNKPMWLIFFCGILNPLMSQILETTSTTYAPTSQIAVMTATVPIFVTLLSAAINKDRPTKKQVFFMCLAVFGVVIINLIGGQMVGGTKLGLILILGTIAVLSFQRTFIRKASAYFTAFESIYIPTAMGAIGFTSATVINHTVKGELSTFFDGLATPEFVIPILYMGIFSCVIAFLCMTYASGHLPIAVSSATGTFSTVITLLVGVFILGEELKPIDIVGIIIILIGIVGVSLSYDKNDEKGNQLAKN
ncbi:DMT family transporter [Tyzzerella sp. OttesenSCG-928-J15]|nr:DMT family transporter [Tyzzerella sp. OttesenSCG-928-J15]